MPPVLTHAQANPSVVREAVALELHAGVGGLAIPIRVGGVGEVELVGIPCAWRRDLGSRAHGVALGQRHDVAGAGMANRPVAVRLEFDVDEVVMEESPIGAAQPMEPRPAPPFKEVVGVVDEVHKHNLVRVEEGQAQRRVGRVVDVGQRHADKGGSGEVQFEVVEVVGGGVAGHLSAQSDCRVGGVGDRHGQGGSGGQVGRREVYAFGEGASRGEAERSMSSKPRSLSMLPVLEKCSSKVWSW